MDVQARPRDKVPETTRWAVLAAVLLIAATAYGGFRAVRLVSDPVLDSTTLKLGGARVQVVAAEQVVGIANSDLMNGMGHNISGLVGADQMMVQVWLRLSSGDKVADYDPSRLRAYVAGSRTPILPASSSLGDGSLTPHALVEGSVSFVVPRSWDHLVLSAVGSQHSIDIPAVQEQPGNLATPEVGTDEHSDNPSDHGGAP